MPHSKFDQIHLHHHNVLSCHPYAITKPTSYLHTPFNGQHTQHDVVFDCQPAVPHPLQAGFSLLELLIVLNLLGLMLAIGWPSLQEMLARQHAQSYIRQFQQHLNFARIMAISSGRVVTFCPRHSGQCLNQWWQIPVQINQQQKNNELKLIRLLDQPKDSHWLYYNREQIQFRQDGSLQALQNGTFVYCAKQYDWHYTLTLSQAGRSQSEFVPAPCPH